MYLWLDEDGRIAEASVEAGFYLGREHAEITGERLEFLVHPDDRGDLGRALGDSSVQARRSLVVRLVGARGLVLPTEPTLSDTAPWRRWLPL